MHRATRRRPSDVDIDAEVVLRKSPQSSRGLVYNSDHMVGHLRSQAILARQNQGWKP